MMALSVMPDWATMIALGVKTVECRSWQTSRRGDILICSTARRVDGFPSGHALCVVTVDDVEPFGREHVRGAVMEGLRAPKGSYAWVLSNARLVEPFPVRGRQGLFTVPNDSVRIVGEPSEELVERLIMPICWRSRDSMADDAWEWLYEEKGWY